MGAIAAFATPTPPATTVIGVVLAAAALGSRTSPGITSLVAWSAGVFSLVTGCGVSLPAYLLVGVPLWAVARWSSRALVLAGAIGMVAGGALAGYLARLAALQVYLIAPTGGARRFSVTPDTELQALALAFAVWSIGLLFLAGGLMGRWRESNRSAQRVGRASHERADLLAAQNALAQERTRISREMHDIVAHSLSVIIAQADGGRYAAAAKPEAALDALEAIARTGRDALSDMRGIVRVLREGPADQTVELRPAPHVRDLDLLVAETRDAGLDVTLVRVGQPRYLPPGVGAALQRIAQEALTNVMKHAGPAARAILTERWHADRIELAVSDDGRGAAAPGDGGGHGVIGMRERAEMLGGVLRAGPGPTGGFQVLAVVPLPAADNKEGGTR
jgi:signal transduction histidine kinase